jgi:hypothetical protein
MAASIKAVSNSTNQLQPTHIDASATIKPIVYWSGTGSITNIITMTSKNSAIDDDPEIAGLTDNELMAEIDAAFGAWKDREDITDDWLDNMRHGWDDRLTDLYGQNAENLSS